MTVVQNFTEESQKYVSSHILSHNCSSTSSLSATPFSGKNGKVVNVTFLNENFLCLVA